MSPVSTPTVPAIPVAPGTFQLPNYHAVYTVGRDHTDDALAEIKAAADRTLDRTLVADIEGFGLGLSARQLKCVTIGDRFGTQAVVLDPRDPLQHNQIRDAFEWADRIVFHNSPFDVPNMHLNGLWDLAWCFKVTDTLIYSRLALPDERARKNLGEAAARWLGGSGDDQLKKTFKALGMSTTEGYKAFDLDRPVYLQGAVSDVLVTAALWPVVRQAAYDTLTKGHPFTSNGVTGSEAWELVEREQILNRRGLWRSCKGMRVDFEFLDRFRATNQQAQDRAEKELLTAGITPGNGQHLLKALDAIGAVPPDHPRTKTGLLQADAKALERLGHPLAKLFLDQKKLAKIGNDYLVKIATLADKNGRVHPQLNFLAATTGRASMNDPPCHQLPNAARGILLADEGDSLSSIDMSQIEPVVLANIAGDSRVISGYERGITDVYTELGIATGMLPPGTTTADTEQKTPAGKALKATRGVLKVVLLAQMYGEGLAKLSADLGLDTGPYEAIDADEAQWRGIPVGTVVPRFAEAKRYRALVFGAMPQSAELMAKLKMIAKQYRKVFTVSGRILGVPVGRFGVEAHKGINFFVQGGAYDVLADAMLRIEREGLGDAFYLSMHDEFIVSTEAAGDIQQIMQTPPERLCWLAKRRPLIRCDREDFGERWGGE